MTNNEFLERLDVIVFHVFALEDGAVLLRETMDIIEEYYTPHIKEIRIRIRYNTLDGLIPNLKVLKDYDKVNIIFVGENHTGYHTEIEDYFTPEYFGTAANLQVEQSLTAEETALELLVNPTARMGMEDYDLGLFLNLRGISHITTCCDIPHPDKSQVRRIEDVWRVLEDTAIGSIKIPTELCDWVGVETNIIIFEVNILFKNFSLPNFLSNAVGLYKKQMDDSATACNIDTCPMLHRLHNHIDPFVHCSGDHIIFTDRHAIFQIFILTYYMDEYFAEYNLPWSNYNPMDIHILEELKSKKVKSKEEKRKVKAESRFKYKRVID